MLTPAKRVRLNQQRSCLLKQSSSFSLDHDLFWGVFPIISNWEAINSQRRIILYFLYSANILHSIHLKRLNFVKSLEYFLWVWNHAKSTFQKKIYTLTRLILSAVVVTRAPSSGIKNNILCSVTNDDTNF